MNSPEAAVESEGRQGDLAQAPPAASPQGPGPAEPRLDALVDQFVSEIERRFPRRVKRRPQALKRRVQYLIRVKLPPRPRPSGRPRRPHITRALDLYRQQQREAQQGKRAEINWTPIALECVPGFARIRSDLKRRIELTRLRNAVYTRERRKKARKPHTHSSDPHTPSAC